MNMSARTWYWYLVTVELWFIVGWELLQLSNWLEDVGGPAVGVIAGFVFGVWVFLGAVILLLVGFGVIRVDMHREG